MAHLHSLTTHTPQYATSAKQIIEWGAEVYGPTDEFRKFRFLVSKSGIANRYSVLPDFSKPAQSVLFKPGEKFTNPSTSHRMEVFHQEVNQMAFEAASLCIQKSGLAAKEFTHLITVSCTGLKAPGLEIALSQRLGLSPAIERYAINFMGCYAAFHAIKLANYISKSDARARILITCAESCTLHFRKTGEADDLLSTVLFGDGAAALIATPNLNNSAYSLEWIAQHTTLLHAPDQMSWKVKDNGFEMKLSQEVPLHIEKHILETFQILMKKAPGIKPDYFAIHPGGKNILMAFQRAMGLDDYQIMHSYKILRDFGNMSSPSVLFVLEEIQRDFLADTSRTEAWVFSAAFGPGLTIETGLLKMSK